MARDIDSSLADVEIVTQDYSIVARCRGLNERLRLIELLNNPEMTHLQLADVRVRRLLTSQEVIAGEGPFFIHKQSVVMGRSLASPEAEARRNELHRLDYVEKAKQLMIVFAPPFRIVGNIQLVREADLTIAMPKLFDSFLAVTEASTVHEGASGLAWDDGFVVVNGRRIEMIGLSTERGSGPTAVGGAADVQERGPPEMWSVTG
jgi:hypothetical protein